MSRDELSKQSLDFAVSIINLVNWLKNEKHELIISNQIGRSGTSIGANIREAKYAVSNSEFVSKMQIALKEANETEYWLELLNKTGYLEDSKFYSYISKCDSILSMLVSSIKTVKNKINN